MGFNDYLRSLVKQQQQIEQKDVAPPRETVAPSAQYTTYPYVTGPAPMTPFGGTFLPPKPPVAYTPPVTQMGTLQEMKNYEQLTPTERWMWGSVMPGIAETRGVKAVQGYIERHPTAAKLLDYVDIPAEGVERTIGFARQFRIGQT
jgi:hypothetical protein